MEQTQQNKKYTGSNPSVKTEKQSDLAKMLRKKRNAGSYSAIFILPVLCIAILTTGSGLVVSNKTIPASVYQVNAAKELNSAPIQAVEETLPLPSVDIPTEAIPAPTQPEKVVPPPITATISFTGDWLLGDLVNQTDGFGSKWKNGARPEDYTDGFSSVTKHDDYTVVNLEGPLTSLPDTAWRDKSFGKASPGSGKDYFWVYGIPDYAKILLAGGVEAVNTANNHSRDYGGDGYTETLSVLQKAGIADFGFQQTRVVDIKGIRVGFFGLYGSIGTGEIKTRIATLRKNGAEFIVATFHDGDQHVYTPTESQVDAAHTAIDLGVDAVIQHHPHTLQAITQYKGKLIVYSLGNFLYGGSRVATDPDTVILQLHLTKSADGVITSTDTIIPCSINSNGGRRNDYRPTILSDQEAARVVARIGGFSPEPVIPQAVEQAVTLPTS